MIMRMILRLRTKNLTTCHGKNLRQNRVELVGLGGQVISFGPVTVFFDCINGGFLRRIGKNNNRGSYSGIRNQNGLALAL